MGSKDIVVCRVKIYYFSLGPSPDNPHHLSHVSLDPPLILCCVELLHIVNDIGQVIQGIQCCPTHQRV